ncbi:RasGTPase-activating protein [Planoprotostelium fungivorum]|uniref:RasGTPase-activating protein n=1 Tax=Planoprotostelium fungivorum TaxID=1890364 RepID=A0A2P6NQ74_9EUKA|nr:RasGTPase-activating protein [Planoprotostelium fungivorum]
MDGMEVVKDNDLDKKVVMRGVLALHSQIKEEQYLSTTDRYVVTHVQKLLAEERKNLKTVILDVQQMQTITEAHSGTPSFSGHQRESSLGANSVGSNNTTPKLSRRATAPVPDTKPKEIISFKKGFKNFFTSTTPNVGPVTESITPEEYTIRRAPSAGLPTNYDASSPVLSRSSGNTPTASPRTSSANIHDLVKPKKIVVDDYHSTIQKPMLRILEKCRNDPRFFSSAIANEGFLSTKKNVNSAASKRLSNSIVTFLFVNCWSVSEECKLLNLLEAMVDEMNSRGFFDDKKTFRMPTFFSEVVSTYIRNTRVREYLSIILQDLLMGHFHQSSDKGDSSDSDYRTGFIDQVLDRITSTVDSLPYGIRILARKLHDVGVSLGWSVEDINTILLRDLLIFSFFMPCLLRPHQYISIYTDSSDAAIAEINKAANYLSAINVNGDFRMTKYFWNVVHGLNQGNDYEKAPSYDDELYPFSTIPKGEFELIIKIISASKMDELSDYSAIIHLIQNAEPIDVSKPEFTALSPTEVKNLLHHFIPYRNTENDTIIVLNRTLIEIIPIPPPTVSDAPIVKEAKKKLFHVLSQLPNLLGVDPSTPVPLCLERQQKYWNKDASSLAAQIYDTVRCLREPNFPRDFSEGNFSRLLREMVQESRDRMDRTEAYKLNIRMLLDVAQIHVTKVNLQKNTLEQNSINSSLDDYKRSVFNVEKELFIEQFKRYLKGECHCGLLEFPQRTCDACGVRSRQIKDFLDLHRDRMENEFFLNQNDDYQIKIALRQLEQNLLCTLHKELFLPVIEDVVLSSKIAGSKGLSPDDFRVPAKLQTDAPWFFAQAELKKINSYAAPYDKYLCVAKCWEILSNCVSMLDDPGPDALWTIMAFVIHAVNIPNFLSNLHYIELYSNLDDLESARMMGIASATMVLVENVKDQGLKPLEDKV